jgi:hypothetical protein
MLFTNNLDRVARERAVIGFDAPADQPAAVKGKG